MTTLYIPEIGDKITLAKDWSFNLYAEHRNVDLITKMGHKIVGYNKIGNKDFPDIPKATDPSISDEKVRPYLYDFNGNRQPLNAAEQEYIDRINDYKKSLSELPESIQTTLPKGTTLSVDRIYIRKGSKDFSSITFWATIPGEKKKVRFWAKLNDCNNIKF